MSSTINVVLESENGQYMLNIILMTQTTHFLFSLLVLLGPCWREDCVQSHFLQCALRMKKQSAVVAKDELWNAHTVIHEMFKLC